MIICIMKHVSHAVEDNVHPKKSLSTEATIRILCCFQKEKTKTKFEERKEEQCFLNVSKFGLGQCVTTETLIIVFLYHNLTILLGRGYIQGGGGIDQSYIFYQFVDSKILVILLYYFTHLRGITCIDALVNGTDFDLYYVGQKSSRY